MFNDGVQLSLKWCFGKVSVGFAQTGRNFTETFIDYQSKLTLVVFTDVPVPGHQ